MVPVASLLLGTFEIFSGDQEGTFRFRLKTPTDWTVMESVEAYTSRDAAMGAIRRAMSSARGARIADLTAGGVNTPLEG